MYLSHPELKAAPLAERREHFRTWHTAALPFIRTKPFIISWSDFCRACEVVHTPADVTPVSIALTKAMESSPAACGFIYDDDATRILVTWCREMQRAVGPTGTFFLGCRDVSDFMGKDTLSHVTASTYLAQFCRDGILELVRKYHHSQRKANEYRYLPPLDE